MNTLTNFKRTLRLAAWLAAGAICAFSAASRAQEQPAPPPPQAASPGEQQPVVVIKKESKLVLVDSVVTDKKGNYVRELTQNDFKVFEDNKEQPVSSFSTGADVATQANGQRRAGPIDGGRGLRWLAAHRAEFHGERGCAPRGGVRDKEFVGRSKRGPGGRARHSGVDRPDFLWLVAGQCRCGFWRAEHASGGAQPGAKSSVHPRPKNGSAVLRWVPADAGKPIGAHGNYRCV